MNKLSKSDLPDQKHDTFWDWLAARPTSEHFAVGTFVKEAHKPPAEVLAVLTCKCQKAEKALRVRYPDGSMAVVQPRALNPNGITH